MEKKKKPKKTVISPEDLPGDALKEKELLMSELELALNRIPEQEWEAGITTENTLHRIDTIHECSPEVKKSLSAEFREHIRLVKSYYCDFEAKYPDDVESPVFDNMDLEISHLNESVDDLANNYIRLGEFFEIALFCNDSIADDIERLDLPANIGQLAGIVLERLRLIEKRILFMDHD